MKRLKKSLKFTAFIPAIVLVGAFVGCHAGVFPKPLQPQPQPPAEPQAIPSEPSPPAAEKPPLFMSGTKSINNKGLTVGLTPAGTNAPDLDVPVRTQPVPNNPPPKFIGGSKSAEIITVPEGLLPANPPNAPKPTSP